MTTSASSMRNSRPIAGVVIIDNLEELTKNQPERIKNDIRDAVEDKLGQWCASFDGILRRYDRDRYIVLMERRDLEWLKAGKFKITEEMHEVESPSGIAASISIGLGADADNFGEALQFADMAGGACALTRRRPDRYQEQDELRVLRRPRLRDRKSAPRSSPALWQTPSPSL